MRDAIHLQKFRIPSDLPDEAMKQRIIQQSVARAIDKRDKGAVVVAGCGRGRGRGAVAGDGAPAVRGRGRGQGRGRGSGGCEDAEVSRGRERGRGHGQHFLPGELIMDFSGS